MEVSQKQVNEAVKYFWQNASAAALENVTDEARRRKKSTDTYVRQLFGNVLRYGRATKLRG